MESTTTAGQILKGIEFARPEGATPLLLDLYLPAEAPAGAGFPAVVHFHGGGWRTGKRSSLGPAVDGLGLSPIEQLVNAGFIVASADYRLSTAATFPVQLLDAKAAVRWLRAHAAEYNVDPERIYAWGDSAGGHLASLVGLTAGAEEFQAEAAGHGPDDAVAAVAAWYPPTDLNRMGGQARPDAVARADDPGSREALLIGAQPADAPDEAAAASPITYAHAAAPPFFLVHGTADRFVPAAQSVTFAAALEGAGAAVELLLIEDADHMWALEGKSPAAAEQATTATIDFFRRQAQAH
ncbi:MULTISPECIES: alpha/beta hydrolase [Micrococcaceae]|uniref:Acetyl esterase/lipase n=1 Tax=Pseudarthrobacter siccitolerans TaxID=861266 RepID=A0ABU0PMK9_9MICC|nr:MULTISPECIES: alpha/beta hydrolase [Micrococcaceae]MDQ0675203.1 acetyl esterase/lipase [Pseudarthrobacter siccitolerans]MDQ0693094.1 acetyl esterase/lipase [Arthrobacter sp. W4I7]